MSQKGAISGPGNHQKGREILYALAGNEELASAESKDTKRTLRAFIPWNINLSSHMMRGK